MEVFFAEFAEYPGSVVFEFEVIFCGGGQLVARAMTKNDQRSE